MNRREFIKWAGAALAVAAIPPLVGGKPATEDESVELTVESHWLQEMPWADDGAIWNIADVTRGGFRVESAPGSPVEISSMLRVGSLRVEDYAPLGAA